MPKRDSGWNNQFVKLVAPAAITLIVCAFVVVIYGGQQAKERISASNAKREVSIAKCVSLKNFGIDAACAEKALDAKYDDATDAYDLKAQQDMSMWALLMLIITSTGVGYVILTLRAATEANEGFKLSAVWQLRAYVSCSVEFEKYSESRIHIFPVCKNGGQTPARNALYNFNLRFMEGELPDDFDFPDKENGTGALQISAGREASGTGIMAATLDFRKAMAGENNLFAWGWIEYSDVFPDSPRRRTEFAMQFIPAPKGKHAWLTVGRHNGSDEECMKEPNT